MFYYQTLLNGNIKNQHTKAFQIISNIFVNMKSFRELCAESRRNSSQRTSLNSSNRSSSFTHSFKDLLKKQPQKITVTNCNTRKTYSIETDTQLFSKLIKESKQNQIEERFQTEPLIKPSVKCIKKKIRINRRLAINQNNRTPIRDMKERIQQEKTTAIVELTSTEKKQIESDLSRVTEKIKQRLTQKQISDYSQIKSAIQQAEDALKGQTQRAFEKILQKRNCILSSIKSKKSKKQKHEEQYECKISTPRFQDSQEEGVGNTDRFQTSLLHTIQQVLSKISIQPMETQKSKQITKSKKEQQIFGSFSRISNNDRFSTKSIKNRLTQPCSSNQSSLLN